MVFTFWEGKMPDYLKLCMKTWKFPYIVLTYDNLHEYTDLQITDRLTSYTLPQIADVVRVHVLRDNGGYWLDTDTIMLSDELPTENMVGYVKERTNTIGYLHTEKNSQMFKMWAKYQDDILKLPYTHTHWGIMGNLFTDSYVLSHPEITIYPVDNCWAETYMVGRQEELVYHAISRFDKYRLFYFGSMFSQYHLSDLRPTKMLMLHNSWTPDVYKNISEKQILEDDRHTLSNILREVLK